MPQRLVLTFLVIAALADAAPLAAHAEDELSIYVGGSIGQSQVDVDSLDFSAHDSGWKAALGVRALSSFGAEAEYVDLGRPHGDTPDGRVTTKASGPAVFALYYLPLPLPHLDVFGKAGVANIQQRASIALGSGGSACVAGVGCDGLNRSESEFAWGGGAQIRAGSTTVRVEFEQFRAPGGALSLGTVGFFWNFP